MVNRVINNFTSKVLVLLLATAMIISCNDEGPSPTYVQKLRIFQFDEAFNNAWYEGISCNEVKNLQPMNGVKVKFYENKIDYLSDQNVLFEEVTDNEGYIEYEQKRSFVDYYFRAEAGDYNNFRTDFTASSIGDLQPDGFEPDDNTCKSYPYISLTLSPSKLSLKVINTAGQPVSGAQVTVYPTEQDYLEENDRWIGGQHDMGGYNLNNSWDVKYSGETNSEGLITFTNLAPRIFWFRVESNEGSNDNGYNHLIEPLSVDPQVTYLTEVVIN